MSNFFTVHHVVPTFVTQLAKDTYEDMVHQVNTFGRLSIWSHDSTDFIPDEERLAFIEDGVNLLRVQSNELRALTIEVQEDSADNARVNARVNSRLADSLSKVEKETTEIASQLRDIANSPFRPISPQTHTSTVEKLAEIAARTAAAAVHSAISASEREADLRNQLTRLQERISSLEQRRCILL